MTRKAIPVEDLTEEEIALIAAAEVDTDEPYDLADLDENGNIIIHRGSGCFLTDQGYQNVAETRVKALLANRVCLILQDRGWSPTAAAEATGLDAEVFVNADRGRSGVGDLIEALTRLGADIVISVGKAREGERGGALVQGPDDE